MAEVVERLVATLEADIRNFSKGMADAQRQFDQRSNAIERRQSAMMRRLNSGFEAPQLTSLINRYLRWGLIIGALSRAMRDQAKTNTDAAAAMAELEKAWNAWAEIAARVLSPILSMTGQLAQNLAAITKELMNANASGAWQRFAEATSVRPNDAQLEQFRRMGLVGRDEIPQFAEKVTVTPRVATPAAPSTATVTPRVATPAADDPFALTAALDMIPVLRDLEQQFMDTLHAEQEFRSEQFLLGRELENQGTRNIREAQEAMAELAQEAELLEQENVADRITAIGDGFEYLARAAFEGAEAFERAIHDMLASLAASGLRNILEGLLGSLVEGGGFVGRLIAGTRASGGPVQAGRAYVVGEERPELFVPSASGTIIPRVPDAVAAGKSITMNFVNRNSFAGAVDANSIRAYADQVGVVSANAAIAAVKKQFPAMMIKSQRDHL